MTGARHHHTRHSHVGSVEGLPLAGGACERAGFRMVGRIRSEVELGVEHGLPEACVISCENVITVPLDDLDPEPVGHLDEITRARLDQALRYALDVMY